VAYVTLVAAVAENGVIGAAGALPWRLPEDLRRFKVLTLGSPVIMGRKTWESLGRALPGRDNIVVTRQPGYAAAGAAVAASLEAALARCAGAERVFVIGGAELYAGDVRFPAFDRAQWREVRREPHAAADGTRFDFVRYERRR
jgi:dihydrofolate reductase